MRLHFATGSFGQHIEVAPDKRTVVAIHSYWPVAFNGELIDHDDTVVDALMTFAGSGRIRPPLPPTAEPWLDSSIDCP